jgi:hypothetical protein
MDWLRVIVIFVAASVIQEVTCNTECNSCADLTRVPDTSGSSVVLASIRLIEKSQIFVDDYQTLRRIAYLETEDGTKEGTYMRENYNGGIWAINEITFNYTKNSLNATVQDQIRLYFGIDWFHVEWEDLRMPIYSALAARLYLDGIAGDRNLSQLSVQEAIWAYNYSTNNELNYTNTGYSDAASLLSNYRNETIIPVTIDAIYTSSLDFTKNIMVPLPPQAVITISITTQNGGTITAYASNFFQPSIAFNCGSITISNSTGHIQLNSSQLSLYGDSNVIYVTLLAKDSITNFTFTASVMKDQGIRNLSSTSNQFFIGLFDYLSASSINPVITITNYETFPVNFSVSSYDGEIKSGVAYPNQNTEFPISDEFVVSNYSSRLHGILVQTDNNHGISVSVSGNDVDSYLALPLIEYSNIIDYTYFAVTSNVESSRINQVLIIAGFNQTDIIIIPTQSVIIPEDLSPTGKIYSASPNESVSLQLNEFETFLLVSSHPLTGTKVTASKPIAFLCGFQCIDDLSCYSIEQFQPTLNWGKTFMFPVITYAQASLPSLLSVITLNDDNLATVTCTNSSGDLNIVEVYINSAGGHSMLTLPQDALACSMLASQPSLLVYHFALNINTSLMMNVPSLHQFPSPPKSFYNHSGFTYIIITGQIDLFNELEQYELSAIYSGNDTLLGYGLQINSSAGDHILASLNNSATFIGWIYSFDENYVQILSMNLLQLFPTVYNESTVLTLSSAIVEVGSNARLVCKASRLPIYEIQWEKESNSVFSSCKYSVTSNSSNTSVLTIFNITTKDLGYYKCTGYSYYSNNLFTAQNILTGNLILHKSIVCTMHVVFCILFTHRAHNQERSTLVE